jgi:hypothetical protein
MRSVRLVILGALCVLLGASATPAPAPQPRDAVDTLVSAFDRVPIVGLGLAHTVEDDEFSITLVRDPRFAKHHPQNIVIECGNALYQPVLDQYIAGGDVPLARLQLVWRNTTQVFGPCNDPHHKTLLDAVRQLNGRLPADRRIRVLAADPPIDWDTVQTPAEVRSFLGRRDENATSVIETQVLAKHQRAVVMMGGFHLHRRHGALVQNLTVTEMLESKHPRSTFVVLSGYSANADVDRRTATWPVPSVAVLHDTWLGLMDADAFAGDTLFAGKPVKPWPGLRLQDLGDAFLYDGPGASTRDEEGPPESDAAYMRELQRRAGFSPQHGIALPAPSPTTKP